MSHVLRTLKTVHDYVALDMDRVIEALDQLEPIERFLGIVRDIEGATST